MNFPLPLRVEEDRARVTFPLPEGEGLSLAERSDAQGERVRGYGLARLA